MPPQNFSPNYYVGLYSFDDLQDNMYYNYTYVPQFTEYAPGIQQPNQGTTNSAPRESTQPEGMANGFYSYVRNRGYCEMQYGYPVGGLYYGQVFFPPLTIRMYGQNDYDYNQFQYPQYSYSQYEGYNANAAPQNNNTGSQSQ